ncbi:MAG: hypothetical protein ABJN26_21215 [Stappiaceae bacterium]
MQSSAHYRSVLALTAQPVIDWKAFAQCQSDAIVLSGQPMLPAHEQDTRAAQTMVIECPSGSPLPTSQYLKRLSSLFSRIAIMVDFHSGPELTRLDVKLSVLEARAGLADCSVDLFARIGASAASVTKLNDLRDKNPRLSALVWQPGTPFETEGIDSNARCETARALVTLHAESFGVQALDWPHQQIDDFALLCDRSKNDGFTGIVVHNSVDVAHANAIFSR